MRVVLQVKMHKVSKMSKIIRPGDHVVAERSLWVVPYEHHGIYVGDGRVIHFADGKIRCVTLQKFSGDGDDLWISTHPSTDKRDAADVVARAKSRLGKRGYDLFDWNCEHFATWCVTGMPFSKQVHDLPWLDGYNRRRSGR